MPISAYISIASALLRAIHEAPALVDHARQFWDNVTSDHPAPPAVHNAMLAAFDSTVKPEQPNP